ncbi:conserved hypothetical protein [Methanococcus maripaludis C5]|uniref:Glycosyltransferase RgtA/B/C/D-like domain-containing protein n=1 Tax=Methanococcus maripaludis (strain C5 / ATCC BAA-1333) TaxID=402880 RepID=A4G0D9_METM5|nr:hypothetical protein [Methanococcus maripaludis]ABO35923.1 conserved hypothetical protein [Methanococcus maripaludis C5]
MKNIKLKLPIFLLIFYILFGVFLQYGGTSEFQSLPSPIYGGDYYYQMGSVMHILSGGDPFESSSILGGTPGYLPLYGIICAEFCKIFEVDAFQGMIYLSTVLFALGSIIWFIAFKTLFKNEWVSLIGVVLANGISIYPLLKYTPFTKQIMIPLFILVLYLSFNNKKTLNYGFLGIIYGLLAISHTVAFVGATLIITTFITYEIYKKYQFNSINGIKEYIVENWKKLGLFTIFGLPISMLYWYKPIFILKLVRPYDRLHMDTPDFGRIDIQIKFFIDSILQYIFNIKSAVGIISSVILIVGIFSLYKSREEENRFFKLFVFGSLFATFCYIITEPLLKMNFVPTYMSSFYLWVSALLISLCGLNYIYEQLIKNSDKVTKNMIVFGSLFLLLTANSAYMFSNYINNDQWAEAGRSEFSELHVSLNNYLIENTDINDVILSTKELSFALNGLSGRKVLVNRWAQQNDPYTNLPERDMIAAIILYGNDTEKKLELIEKYNIQYLYWDYYWINSEYQFDDNNNLIGMYDPLIAYSDDSLKTELMENNVSYYEMNYWVDPSQRRDDIRKYDLMYISPENYRSYQMPWNTNLNEYLTEVWNYSYQDQKIAVLYKINVKK